jgi:hypothetical protein
MLVTSQSRKILDCWTIVKYQMQPAFWCEKSHSSVVERMKANLGRDKKLAGREGEKLGFADPQESRADLPPSTRA